MGRNDKNRGLSILFLLAAIGLISVVAVALRQGLLLLPYPMIVGVFFVLWTIFVWKSYTEMRRSEFTALLIGAIAEGVPLLPAIRAYLADRPKNSAIMLALMLLMVFLFPPFWFCIYTIWWRRYDRKLADLCQALEEGRSLSECLELYPGIVDRDTQLAIFLGEATHRPALALSCRESEEASLVWIESVTRLIYPLALVVLVHGLMFGLAYLFEKQLSWRNFYLSETWPPIVRALRHYVAWMSDGHLFVIVVSVLFLVALLLFELETLRWDFPIVGRYFRGETQGNVLCALGVTLEAGATVPEAIHMLLKEDLLPAPAFRRLRTAASQVAAGVALPQVLADVGLLPRAYLSVVSSSIPVGRLPTSLLAIGGQLRTMALERLRVHSLLLSPILLVIAAGFCLFFTAAIFDIMLDMIERNL